jgi:hypothetical protein
MQNWRVRGKRKPKVEKLNHGIAEVSYVCEPQSKIWSDMLKLIQRDWLEPPCYIVPSSHLGINA